MKTFDENDYEYQQLLHTEHDDEDDLWDGSDRYLWRDTYGSPEDEHAYRLADERQRLSFMLNPDEPSPSPANSLFQNYTRANYVKEVNNKVDTHHANADCNNNYCKDNDVRIDSSNPKCPLCNKLMVKRLAKRGGNAGGYFWGCTAFPSCRGTRSIYERRGYIKYYNKKPYRWTIMEDGDDWSVIEHKKDIEIRRHTEPTYQHAYEYVQEKKKVLYGIDRIINMLMIPCIIVAIPLIAVFISTLIN